MGYSITNHAPTPPKQVQYKNYLDHVYAVSDDFGDILEHYRYTAFGEVQIYNANGNQVATTQIDNHILWNTRRRDELTGYYMYKFRHYSAELGRWLARDPIEEQGGVNLYGYCYNSPYNSWDKLGGVPDWVQWALDNLNFSGAGGGVGNQPEIDRLVERLNKERIEAKKYPGYIPEIGKDTSDAYNGFAYFFRRVLVFIELECDHAVPYSTEIEYSSHDVNEIVKVVEGIPKCCCIKTLTISAHSNYVRVSAYPNQDRIDEHADALTGTMEHEELIKRFGAMKGNFCANAYIDLKMCHSKELAEKINQSLEENGNNVYVSGYDGLNVSIGSQNLFPHWHNGVTF